MQKCRLTAYLTNPERKDEAFWKKDSVRPNRDPWLQDLPQLIIHWVTGAEYQSWAIIEEPYSNGQECLHKVTEDLLSLESNKQAETTTELSLHYTSPVIIVAIGDE